MTHSLRVIGHESKSTRGYVTLDLRPNGMKVHILQNHKKNWIFFSLEEDIGIRFFDRVLILSELQLSELVMVVAVEWLLAVMFLIG